LSNFGTQYFKQTFQYTAEALCTANGCNVTILQCATLSYSSINSPEHNCTDEGSETAGTPES